MNNNEGAMKEYNWWKDYYIHSMGELIFQRMDGWMDEWMLYPINNMYVQLVGWIDV